MKCTGDRHVGQMICTMVTDSIQSLALIVLYLLFPINLCLHVYYHVCMCMYMCIIFIYLITSFLLQSSHQQPAEFYMYLSKPDHGLKTGTRTTEKQVVKSLSPESNSNEAYLELFRIFPQIITVLLIVTQSLLSLSIIANYFNYQNKTSIKVNNMISLLLLL